MDISALVPMGEAGFEARPVHGAGESSFGDVFAQALQSLERAQAEGDRQATAVAVGEGNLHEMSIALEKADLAMRVAVKVRNKFVEAYNELMRMPV